MLDFRKHSRNNSRPTLEHSAGSLLRLRDIITEELMRNPDVLDRNGEPCSLVAKSGSATNVTVGRANGIFSFVRDPSTGEESREWAIFNYSSKSDAFSEPGDSGSVVADGFGRIGGIITSGTGPKGFTNVTYATPMWWLWPRIEKHFPGADLYPTETSLRAL